MIDCYCNPYKRSYGPAGLWTIGQMIGAKVKLKSLPIMNTISCDTRVFGTCTIHNIMFRVTQDGKTITTIELEEAPGTYFTWKDLEVLNVNLNGNSSKAICGEAIVGNVICGV